MAITILGISPGTRSIGIAVFSGSELIEWQVKSFKIRWSKEKLNLILKCIDSLCEYFKIEAIAIKEPNPLQTTDHTTLLMQSITALVRAKRLKLYRYGIADLKKHANSNLMQKKDDILEIMTEKYPMLRREYLKERNSVRPYHVKMFEAIAAAQMLSSKLEW